MFGSDSSELAGHPSPTPPAAGHSRAARVLRLHVPMVLAVAGCLLAGWFELSRALNGRMVAWVYAVEWPLFAVIGVYMWWRLLHPDRPSGTGVGGLAGSARSPLSSKPEPAAGGPAEAAGEDAGLAAWQRYLADLHASDPPGGPPRDSSR